MYRVDFIRRAAAYKDEGYTFRELRDVFYIPAETYYMWKRKLQNGYDGTKAFRERTRKTDKKNWKKPQGRNRMRFFMSWQSSSLHASRGLSHA
jgi:transposase